MRDVKLLNGILNLKSIEVRQDPLRPRYNFTHATASPASLISLRSSSSSSPQTTLCHASPSGSSV